MPTSPSLVNLRRTRYHLALHHAGPGARWLGASGLTRRGAGQALEVKAAFSKFHVPDSFNLLIKVPPTTRPYPLSACSGRPRRWA
jgi:hypothetical protein